MLLTGLDAEIRIHLENNTRQVFGAIASTSMVAG